jgi:signal peptidase II
MTKQAAGDTERMPRSLAMRFFMILYLLLAGVLVAADQLIKMWAQEVLKPVVSIDIIPNVLSLYYHENFGAAWGILQGQRWLLLGVTGIVLIGLLAALMLKKFKGPLLQTAVALILAGGVGNLLDRALHTGGYVVDYIYFEPINFPIFNLADVCVCIGTGLLAIYILFVEGKKKTADQEPKPVEAESVASEPVSEKPDEAAAENLPEEGEEDPPCGN